LLNTLRSAPLSGHIYIHNDQRCSLSRTTLLKCQILTVVGWFSHLVAADVKNYLQYIGRNDAADLKHLYYIANHEQENESKSKSNTLGRGVW